MSSKSINSIIENEISTHWPPVYTVKRHPLSKRVKLKASLKKGLELIVPPKFNLKHIPKILLENKSWIEKQLKYLQQAQHTEQPILPSQIFLHAIGQTWQVHYIESEIKLQIITRPHQEIVLTGNIKNKIQCQKLLIAWVKNLAKTYLINQLNIISHKIQLPYKNATIRDQETRWGSCTKNKNISLNYKILFLPEHLATHILIHELCHTVHFNHSDRFWKLVEKFDPSSQEHRKAIKKVDAWVPLWA